MNDFQIGDRVKLVETELKGVAIGKSYGDVPEVRCDNGLLVRELRLKKAGYEIRRK